jgi:hypothetical protein
MWYFTALKHITLIPICIHIWSCIYFCVYLAAISLAKPKRSSSFQSWLSCGNTRCPLWSGNMAWPCLWEVDSLAHVGTITACARMSPDHRGQSHVQEVNSPGHVGTITAYAGMSPDHRGWSHVQVVNSPRHVGTITACAGMSPGHRDWSCIAHKGPAYRTEKKDCRPDQTI